jgi:hypothetical protein
MSDYRPEPAGQSGEALHTSSVQPFLQMTYQGPMP